jgi:integrase
MHSANVLWMFQWLMRLFTGRKEGRFMSEPFNYNSIYAPYFKSFIKMKQDLGVNILRTKWILLEFDKFFVSMGVRDLYITANLIDQWRKTRVNDVQRTIYTKYSVWSQFCKYMCNLGHECYIPRLPKAVSKGSFTPYIFSHKQMEDIFRTCDSLRLHDKHMSTILFVMPTVVRLMYGTGIRVSEALSLKNDDIDFDHHCIILRKTKNGEQRLAPLSDTLQKVIEEYVANRNMMPLPKVNAPKGYFFISPSGNFCRAGSVYCWFRKVLAACGIQHIGNHQGPFVHSLRHTFAVHSLMKMTKSGYDLYFTLPILSTYMGHKSIGATEQYVRLTEEMYPELLEDQRKICSYVFPGIKMTEEDGNN